MSKATRMTPFSLVYGMEPHMPYFDLEEKVNYDDNRSDLLVNLQKMRRVANEVNLKYKSFYEQQFNKACEAQKRVLNVGDHILVENSHKTGPNPKLQPLYLGPFPVVGVDEVNVQYVDFRGKKRASHLNRVKKAIIPRKRERDEENSPKNESKKANLRNSPNRLLCRFDEQVHEQLSGLADEVEFEEGHDSQSCLLYTSPSPRDGATSRMPSSA